MKFKTVIQDRFPKKNIKFKRNKLIIALLIFSEVLFNTIFPFAMGVYFGMTKHIFFLVLFIFPLFFNIRIRIDKKNQINFEIVRGI
jgi:hypothetical protein